jgi:hypothetical protein
MPGYGRTITIRHLLTHTSGLRDYIALMTLGGWQFEDLTTSAQALDGRATAEALDFPPGTEFAYSNTGFFLSSLIVDPRLGHAARDDGDALHGQSRGGAASSRHRVRACRRRLSRRHVELGAVARRRRADFPGRPR